MEWESQLKNFAQDIQADLVGYTQLKIPLTWSYYSSWIDQNYHGEMSYLKDHAPLKQHPEQYQPEMKSALVFGFIYQPHPEARALFPSARTALYAQGLDYHHWMKERLNQVIEKLKAPFPEAHFLACTDSSPILERDLAHRAGLGWFGKNTCLISQKKGSLFLIGEILTSLEMNLSFPTTPDLCGTCTKCLDVCPTQALVKPHVLDAKKCISYWTIESRQIPPPELRDKMGDWLFGCDLCQTICPWNQKAFQKNLEITPQRALSDRDRKDLIAELQWILSSSNNQILKKLKGTPLLRAGGKGLKRNALIVAANQKLHELSDCIQKLKSDEYLAELAQWTLKKLES